MSTLSKERLAQIKQSLQKITSQDELRVIIPELIQHAEATVEEMSDEEMAKRMRMVARHAENAQREMFRLQVSVAFANTLLMAESKPWEEDSPAVRAVKHADELLNELERTRRK